MEMKSVKSKEISMVQSPLETAGGNVYYPSQPTKLGTMSLIKAKVIGMVQSPIESKN